MLANGCGQAFILARQEAAPADGPDPSKMTIADIKAWLMDAGQEAKVWELTQGKAKKAQWVALMRASTCKAAKS